MVKKDLEWARICRLRFSCVCWGWRVLCNNVPSDTPNLYHCNFPFFLCLPLCLFRVILFSFKAIFQWPVCQIRHCVTKEHFLAGHAWLKRREKHRINKHRRRKGVHFMTDGFQCVCVPASFGTSYNCYGFKHPRTCYSVASQCSALHF